MTLFAAASGLFATIVLPRPSSRRRLEAALSTTVTTTCEILSLSLASVLDSTSTAADSLQQQHLARDLRTLIPKLKSAHNEYCSEFTRGHIAPAALRPYIKALQRIQRNALLGPTSHIPGERIKAAMEKTYERNSRPGTPRGERSGDSRSPSADRTYAHTPDLQKHARQKSHMIGQLTVSTDTVTKSIRESITRTLAVVRNTYGWIDGAAGDKKGIDLEQCRSDLETAVAVLQRRLSSMMDELGVSPGINHQHASIPYRDRWRIAFYVVALIDLAKDIDHLLDITIGLRAGVSAKRFWLPFTKANGRPPPEPLSNGVDDDPPPDPEKHLEDLDFVTATLYQTRMAPLPDTLVGRIEHHWRRFWDQKAVLQGKCKVYTSSPSDIGRIRSKCSWITADGVDSTGDDLPFHPPPETLSTRSIRPQDVFRRDPPLYPGPLAARDKRPGMVSIESRSLDGR